MIDDVRIESEDDGFHLILEGDFAEEAGRYFESRLATEMSVRLSQSAALALRAAVHEQIDDWWAGGEAVRLEFEQRVRAAERAGEEIEGGGYDLDDPKHPTYRERMADAADQARKEAKENG